MDVARQVRLLVWDAVSGHWLQFTDPREIVSEFSLAVVASALHRVEEAVTQRGLYAAGFVSCKAAPVFDPALTVRDSGDFPLLWFGLFDGAKEVDLPTPVPGLDLGKTTWQASVGCADFAENVSRIKELIRSGDSYPVNYSYRLRTTRSWRWTN